MVASLNGAIVRIYSNSGKAIGAGFLVSDNNILTCAHVVAFALGIRADTPNLPTGKIYLDFPRVDAGRKIEAKVIFWLPMNPDLAREDIAGLELLNPIPDNAHPVRLLNSEDLWGHQFRVFGFPEGKSNGVWASGVLRGGTAKEWVQLEDVKETGYRLDKGFSGAPVWDEELQGVVGMAVAAEQQRQEIKVAFIIPANVLVQAWEVLRERAISSCPYRGLFAFREEDAQFFFGRKVFTKQLVAEVAQRQLVAVIGASGSGKSSVVFAGLIPQLREQGGWLIESFRPGDRPFRNLAARLLPLLEGQMSETDRLAEVKKLTKKLDEGELIIGDVLERIVEKRSGERLLLVADQFEELYTLCREDAERQRFLDGLLEACDHVSRLTFVLTLRADFLSYALSYRPFADALQNADVKLAPMNEVELRDIIEEPAKVLGVRLESGLTERILAAVKGKSGFLPLLEFALEKLWSRQENGVLTHESYKEIGEVEMALADYADREYQNLNEQQQQQAQQIFIQLVNPGIDTEHTNTRRLATRDEVGVDNWDVVTSLADSRLVVTGTRASIVHFSSEYQESSLTLNTVEETVEIVHEALILKWERLKEWINADSKFRRWQERLRAAIYQWQVNKEDRGALLRGFPLDEANNWLEKRRTYLSQNERKYIESSLNNHKAEEKERQDKEFEMRIVSEENEVLEQAKIKAEKNIRRGLVVLAGSFTLAVTLLGFSIFSYQQQQEAFQGTKLEQAGVSALRQLRSGEIEALLSAMQSGQTLKQLIGKGRTPENYPAVSPILALQKILDTIYEHNRLSSLQEEGKSNQNEVKSASFSPDGTLVATAGRDGIVRLWNSSGEKQAELEGHEGGVLGGVNSIAFSPKDKKIVTAGNDNTVRIWNFTGQELVKIDKHSNAVNTVSFSPDGQKIVSAGRDGMVYFWTLSGQESLNFEAHSGEIYRASFSPDGTQIATAGQDGVIRLWDTSGQKLAEIAGHEGKRIFSVSFSPDGTLIATGGADNTARIWNLSGEEQVRLEGHQGWVTRVNFSPNGRRLATAADDGTAAIWDISGNEIARLQGHRGVVWSADFSPDGNYLVTSGRDGTVRLWNLSKREKVQFLGFQKDVNTIAFSPDGKQIIGAGDEGIARIWTVTGEEVVQWPANSRGAIWAVAFSPDGESVATAGYESIIRLWNKSGELTTTLRGHRAWVNSLDFSPDGKWLATSGADKTARLWDIAGELLVTLEGHEAVVGGVKISPDGQKVVTGDWNGEIRLWNQSGKLLKQWQGHDGQIRDLSFSVDSKQLVTVDNNSVVKIWAISGKLLLEFFSYQSGINAVGWSQDNDYIATGGMDGTVRIWDLQGRQVAEFGSDRGAVWGLHFSSDGQSIVAGLDNGTVELWEIKDLDELLIEGCQWLEDYLQRFPKQTDTLSICISD